MPWCSSKSALRSLRHVLLCSKNINEPACGEDGVVIDSIGDVAGRSNLPASLSARWQPIPGDVVPGTPSRRGRHDRGSLGSGGCGSAQRLASSRELRQARHWRAAFNAPIAIA